MNTEVSVISNPEWFTPLFDPDSGQCLGETHS